MKKTRVFVIDDSALIRNLLTQIINSQPDMEVIGAASDPLAAREMIRATNPDVLTLDIEMPRMDGLTFLEKLMRLHPMPVVMISTLTNQGSDVRLRALELGAVDYIVKSKMDIRNGMESYTDEITNKIRAASTARVRRLEPLVNGYARPAHPRPTIFKPQDSSTEKLIVVGASTGGTEAIKDFLIGLPSDCPGILITQHMPPAFTRSFAERLDRLSKIRVAEARGGERILPGHAYLAPGHSHLLLKKNGANYVTELSQAEPVNRFRPSVDVLFHSAAKYARSNAIGVILTGMGKDGAAGMLAMRQAGAYNFAQNEASCVVFGMPREAIAIGAVEETVPLPEMTRRVMNRVAAMSSRSVRM